jgi:glycosyltransferase involved in cell wall biosynthesis
MKILFVAHFFPPEIGAGSIRAGYFFKLIRECGLDIKVITPIPNYPDGKKYEGYKTFFKRDKDLNVIYLPYLFTKSKSVLLRGLSYVTYFLTAILYSIFDNYRADIVMCSTPPITTALASMIITKVKRAKMVIDIRDIWPDIGIELGLLKNSQVINLLRKIEKLLLVNSIKIIVTAIGDKENLIKKNTNPSKIEVIYNGADTDIFRPVPDDEIKIKRGLYNLPINKKLLVYFGSFNYGMNDIQTLLESLSNLHVFSDSIHFVAIGGGKLLDYLIDGLTDKINYSIFNNIEPSQTASIVSICDVSLVPRKFIEKDTGGNIPVKCFESWAAGVPVVLSSTNESEITKILKECGGGVIVEPGNAQSFRDGIIELLNDPEIKSRGKRASAFVRKNFDRKIESRKLIGILNNC